MESGKYYVRLVYSQEEVTTGIVDTANTFAYTNSSQPETITAIHAENAGDLQIRASLDTVTDDKCQGALFKVYEVGANGEKEELSDYNVSAVKTKRIRSMRCLAAAANPEVSMKTEKKPLRPSD